METFSNTPATNDLLTSKKPSFDEILDLLGSRFRQDKIYTNIGDILLSVNPHKNLPIYGPQVGREYILAQQSGDIRSLSPHVFNIVNIVVKALRRHQIPQCILLSGESGAGKTETLKMFLSQLQREDDVMRHTRHLHDSPIGSKILQAVNLLDFFGCAVTPSNRNASCYTKLWQVFFNEDGFIEGARVHAQGLDRSRVMFQEAGQSNFHVFYQLLAGLSRPDQDQYFLEDAYRILENEDQNQVFRSEESYMEYKEDFDFLWKAMTSLGLDYRMQSNSRGDSFVIFGLLSAILSLGNIHFAPDPETDEVFIPNERAVDIAAMLLAVPVRDLMTLFLANTSHVQGERTVRMNDFSQACVARNSLVRFLYGQFFDWIVQQINTSLCPADVTRDLSRSISILDCPGHENFNNNCFEQLCHNIADEKIQHHITRGIFMEELHDLDKDGVRGYRAKFHDVSVTSEMFSYPKSRFFTILDEESAISTSTPASFLKKMKKQLGKNKLFVQIENNANHEFAIIHTRGQVTYDASLLLTKNRDKLDSHTVEIMKQSRNPLVAQLFATSEELNNRNDKSSSQKDWTSAPQWTSPNRSYNESISRQTGRKLKKSAKRSKKDEEILSQGPSRLSKYMSSFEDLLNMLKGCETHYIWCIQPNQTSQPNYFDPPYVFRQLTNILETVCQRKWGYPVRIPIEEFLDRYQFLALPITADLPSMEGACYKILQESQQHGWTVGRTKVFLPMWCEERLDELLALEEKNVVVVQSEVRGFVARRQYRRVLKRQKQNTIEISNLGDDIFKNGGRAFFAQREQRDHDNRKYERALNEYEQQRQQYGHYQRHLPSTRPPRHNFEEMEDFQRHTWRSVIQRKEELDSSTWCKVLCMEYGKEIGKVYIQEKEFLVDGSYDKFDGRRLGLGVFQNTDRDDVIENIRGAIMQGVVIRKDTEGNIWAKRLSRYDVIVKGYQDPGNHCMSAEVILNQGHLPYNEQVKIFDATEFKSQVGLQLKRNTRGRLQFLSLVGLSFVQDMVNDLDTPCWLYVVNIMALNALESNDLLQDVQMMIAGVDIKTEKETEEEDLKIEVKKRHHRDSWSKTDRRENLLKKESPRKLREELRRQGKEISTHFDYSWTKKPSGSSGNMMTLEDLQEMKNYDSQDPYNTDSGGLGRRQSKQRDWAKVKVTVKELSAKETGETEAAQKARFTKY